MHSTPALTFDPAAAHAWLRQPSRTDGFTQAESLAIAAAICALAHIAHPVCPLVDAYQRANPGYAAATEVSR